MFDLTVFGELLSKLKAPPLVLGQIVPLIQERRNEKHQSVAAEIRSLLIRTGSVSDDSTFEVDGVELDLVDYTNSLVLTGSREAHTHEAVTRLAGSGIPHVRISHHPNQERNECAPYAGRVFFIGHEATDPLGFPRLDLIPNGGPPFRPSCRHVTQAFVVALQPAREVKRALAAALKLPNWCFTRSRADVRLEVSRLSGAKWQDLIANG